MKSEIVKVKAEVVPAEPPVIKTVPIQKHELRIRECSLGSDGIIWNDGYNRGACSCGWLSTPVRGSDKNVAITRLFELHVKMALFEAQQGRT